MDALKDKIQNISIYDVKAYVRKAQNAVMNYTEIETKVREATNNEPWGASSTLMQEIAQATNNYQQRVEAMSFILRRFQEKSAHEWRQIYKALQLLEYLIKHGSERVIDDARTNLSLIQMLKGFHYIDQNGKDQGINVRNRAKELVALLNDDNLIRAERKKARENLKKYSGMSSTGYTNSGPASVRGGQRYPASSQYDSDYEETGEYGGYAGGVYGDGGVFGERYDADSTTSYGASRKSKFEEYDDGSEGNSETENRANASTATSKVNASGSTSRDTKPVTSLVDFDDFDTNTAGAAEEDDEFDDFQTAVPATETKPALSKDLLADLFNSSSSTQPTTTSTATVGISNDLGAFMSNVPTTSSNNFGGFAAAPPTSTMTPSTFSTTQTAPVSTKKTTDDPFSTLFTTAKKEKKPEIKPATETTSQQQQQQPKTLDLLL